MDLATSRRPQPIPGPRVDLRAQAAGRPEVLDDAARGLRHALDPLGREVLAALAESGSLLPAELTRRVAAPRITIQERVLRLTRALVLDTPRARLEVARVAANEGVSLLGARLEAGSARDLVEALRATLGGLVGLDLATSPEARAGAVLALTRPVIAALDERERGLRDSERFATRTAFGLPEPTPPDQGGRFLGRLEPAVRALSPAAAAELMALVEGGPSALAPWTTARREALIGLADRLAPAAPPTSQPDVDDLAVLAAEACAHALLASAREVLAALGPAGALEIFLHDAEVLLGRAAPRPLPAWLGA